MTNSTENVSSTNAREIAAFVNEVRYFIDTDEVRIVLDIGSRDAEVAVALKKAFSNAKVFAFECNPSALNLCKARIAANGDTDIVLVPAAVSDEDGIVTFYAIDPEKTVTPHSDGNIGASSLFQANPEYPLETYFQTAIAVESTMLSTWAEKEGLPNIDIIWMDIQGAELKALRGLGQLLKNVRIIYTEVEYKPLYLGQPLFTDVDEFLRGQGFRLHKQLNRSEWFGDAMYVRRSMPHKLLGRILRKISWLRLTR